MFAYALIHSTPPEVLFAENAEVLSEVIAREVISRTPGSTVNGEVLEKMRRALVNHDWEDALVLWMDYTGLAVDIFDHESVRTADQLTTPSYHSVLLNSPLYKD